MKLTLRRTMAVLCWVVGVGNLSCQTYDFEPIEPFAVAQGRRIDRVAALKPNIMLVVDTSFSMTDPVTPSATRMDELKRAMGEFVPKTAKFARLGLSTFPKGGVCDVSNETAVPMPAETDAALQASAEQILSKLNGLVPNGGTPTAAALRALTTSMPDNGYVILLTDGLPNCNQDITSSCENDRNRCTHSSLAQCSDKRNCLNDDETVAQLTALRAKKIDTFVIGFGADTAGSSAKDTLNKMAVAGGKARDCAPTDTTCRRFYQAGNADELIKLLDDIIVDPSCEYELQEPPQDPRFISVLVDGNATPASGDTWRFDTNKVVFKGDMCKRLKSSTDSQPVNLEIRYVNAL